MELTATEAIKIYEEYLSGDVQTLEKINNMKSSGMPVDCIECGACSSQCPNGLNIKELMRELAMMQSCGRLMEFSYGGRKESVG